MVRAGSARSTSVTKWMHLPVPLTCFYGGTSRLTSPTVRWYFFSYRFIVETVSGYGVQACAVIRRGRPPGRPVKHRAIFLCDKAQFTCTILRHMDLLTFRAGDDTLSINRGNRLPVFPCDKRCKRCKRDKRDIRDKTTVPLTHISYSLFQ